MTADQFNKSAGNRENQISVARKQLLSSAPDIVRKGIDQVRFWLAENPEDQEIYDLLLSSAKETPSLTNEIQNLLQEMKGKGSLQASKALIEVNKQLTIQVVDVDNESHTTNKPLEAQSTSEQDLISKADDEYYAAEYDKAYAMYQQVLRDDPNNIRARQQLEKITLNRMARITSYANSNLPRDAVQDYRRARSYIAAKDFKLAIELLRSAMGKAQAYGKKFPEAELFLNMTEDQIIAAEHKIAAENAVREEKWENAVSALKQALNFDPSDDVVQKTLGNLQGLLKAESLLDPFGMQVSTERSHRLDTINSVLKETEEKKEFIDAKRYKIILAKNSLYKAETNLHKWGIFTALAPQGRLSSILKVSKKILSSQDPTIDYVEEQLKRLRPARSIVFIFLFLFALYGLSRSNFGLFALIVTSTPTLTNAPATTVITNPSETPTVSTITVMPGTPTLTPSLTIPAPSTTAPLDIGYINANLFHPQDQPNGKWVGVLTQNEPVTILEQKVVVGDQWYLVQWENKTTGEVQQGWILSEFVTIGPPPQ